MTEPKELPSAQDAWLLSGRSNAESAHSSGHAQHSAQPSPPESANPLSSARHVGTTAEAATDSPGDVTPATDHLSLQSRPSSLQSSRHASPFTSPRSSLMLSPGMRSGSATPTGVQSPAGSEHVDWLRTDFHRQQNAFLDDLAFIQEVQSQQSLAAGMNPSLQLQALHKRFRNWKSQFKVTSLSCGFYYLSDVHRICHYHLFHQLSHPKMN